MRNQKTLMLDGFKGAIPLITHEKDEKAKAGYLKEIFGYYGALSGPSGVKER